jgi:hypothetical protein
LRKLTGSTTTAAVLEAIVIFIGILGALFADSWWEQRQTLSREVSYLEDLTTDFTENRARLNEQIVASDGIIEAALILLAFESPASARLFGTDSLTSLLHAIHLLPTFEPVNKTYDNILGAGELLTLRDRVLRAALANFQARLALMSVVQETQERQYVSLFQPYVIEHLDYLAIATLTSDVSLPTARDAESIYGVVGSREFRNWIFARLDWADDIRHQHERVLRQVDEVLQNLAGTTS